MATNQQNVPRAVIHRQILDSAATQPEASMEELAEEVPGASTELVERVLEEYGDPAESASDAGHTTVAESPEGATPEEEPMTDAIALTVADFTHKELETLQAIAEDPEATQGELAERLGVTRATVNKRLNDIDGFEWHDRQAFVAAVFGDEAVAMSVRDEPATDGFQSGSTIADDGQGPSSEVERALGDLQERVVRLEQHLRQPATEAAPRFDDTELLAKIVRAVLADETISSEEELRVLNALL